MSGNAARVAPSLQSARHRGPVAGSCGNKVDGQLQEACGISANGCSRLGVHACDFVPAVHAMQNTKPSLDLAPRHPLGLFPPLLFGVDRRVLESVACQHMQAVGEHRLTLHPAKHAVQASHTLSIFLCCVWFGTSAEECRTETAAWLICNLLSMLYHWLRPVCACACEASLHA